MEFNNKKPIYIQIEELIYENILKQQWKAGDKVPSIREFALYLQVNPNTVAKAFQNMINRGIFMIKRGIGNYITDNAYEIVLEIKKNEFFKYELPELLKKIKLLKIDKQKIIKYIMEE